MSAAAAVLNTTGGGGGGGGGLSVTILAGSSAAASGPAHTFPTNTATPAGGTSPYTEQWQETDDGLGTWTTGTGSTFAPHVSGVSGGDGSMATYICKVTDNVGNVAYSNVATYYYYNFQGGGGIIP